MLRINKKLILSLIIPGVLLFSWFISEILAQTQNKPLKIYFFHSPRCGACRKVKQNVLPKIIKNFGEKIEILYLNVLDRKNYEFMLELCKKTGVPDKKAGLVPKVIVNDKVLIGYNQINKKFVNLINQELLNKKIQLHEVDTDRVNILLEKFKGFKIGAVLGAGLIDGINPCAFATIIFFISFLGVAGYKRKELATIGSIFITVVFITYLLLGIGLFTFLFHLKIYKLLSNLLYIFIILFTLLVAGLNFLDFYNLKKKKLPERKMKLQLPQSIKKMIHKIIGTAYSKEKKFNENKQALTHTSWIRIVFVTLIAGVTIAILESACTGQIYLPTISFIAQGAELKIQAIGYLVAYNIMFTLPLLAIFLLALFGITSEELAQFSRRHLGVVKLFTGIFLLILAAGLYIYMLL